MEASQYNRNQRKEDDERLAIALEKFFSNAEQQEPQQMQQLQDTDTNEDEFQDALQQHEVE